jgi:hypothetical protein
MQHAMICLHGPFYAYAHYGAYAYAYAQHIILYRIKLKLNCGDMHANAGLFTLFECATPMHPPTLQCLLTLQSNKDNFSFRIQYFQFALLSNFSGFTFLKGSGRFLSF